MENHARNRVSGPRGPVSTLHNRIRVIGLGLDKHVYSYATWTRDIIVAMNRNK